MDALACITTRMSIRKFKSDAVPLDLLKKVIDTAKRSPSYKNSQPWEVIIVSGTKKQELTEYLEDLLKKNTSPCPDMPEPESWPAVNEARINALMKKRTELTGLDFDDPEVRKKAKIANFRFYGAPHGIFLFQDASLTSWSLFDLGLFAQNLMLTAHAFGLGTVPQAFLTDYAQHVKKFLEIVESKRLVLGISIGYPDMDSPVNSYRTERVSTDELLKIIS